MIALQLSMLTIDHMHDESKIIKNVLKQQEKTSHWCLRISGLNKHQEVM